jgi:predicted RNase H-like nuclease (RuvC/YqgF family)
MSRLQWLDKSPTRPCTAGFCVHRSASRTELERIPTSSSSVQIVRLSRTGDAMRPLDPSACSCFVLAGDRARKAPRKVIRTGSGIDGVMKTEQRETDVERKLAKAEARVRKLQDKVDVQQQQIRELLAQINNMKSLNAEHTELQAEVRDLRGEAKELTRANREQVRKNEVLQAENTRLKIEVKARKLAA